MTISILINLLTENVQPVCSRGDDRRKYDILMNSQSIINLIPSYSYCFNCHSLIKVSSTIILQLVPKLLRFMCVLTQRPEQTIASDTEFKHIMYCAVVFPQTNTHTQTLVIFIWVMRCGVGKHPIPLTMNAVMVNMHKKYQKE